MTPLEQREIRGITWKQAGTYIVVAVSFIISLVYRDVKRENELETLRTKMQAIEIKMEAAEKERNAMKILSNTQDMRLTKIETRMEYLKTK